MSECDPQLHDEGERIERAQAHSMRKVLNRQVRLAEIDPHPPTEMPRVSQIRIEAESPIDEGGAGVDIMHNIGKREPCPCERDRVIPAHLRRLPSQPSCFRGLPGAVQHPTLRLPLDVAPRSHAIGRREIRVDFNRPIE
jgi:hypothetical protein